MMTITCLMGVRVTAVLSSLSLACASAGRAPANTCSPARRAALQRKAMVRGARLWFGIEDASVLKFCECARDLASRVRLGLVQWDCSYGRIKVRYRLLTIRRVA